MQDSAQRRIGAVFVCDERYHDLTLLSAASLARAMADPLDIHIFQHGYARPVPGAFKAFVARHGHRVATRRAGEVPAHLAARRARPARGYVSDTTFAKPDAIEALSAEYDYLLYADGDILFFEDFGLARMADFDALVAACLDFPLVTGDEGEHFQRLCTENGVDPIYVNAGLFLVNCARWRDTGALARYRENVADHNRDCRYLGEACVLRDQCPFNLTVAGDLKLLELSHNVQRWALYTPQWHAAKARHYTGRRKFDDAPLYKADRREHRLLRRLRAEAGLSEGGRRFYDGGLSYALNGVRRRRDIRTRQAALAALPSEAGRA